MTTPEVSIIPRWSRGESGTRFEILGCNIVDVRAKARQVDAWRTTEHGDGGIGVHEPIPPKRSQLTDGCTVSGNDGAFALVQSPHDLAAVIPKLPLGDVSGRDDIL